MGDQAVVLSEQDIAGLGDQEFSLCADVLGAVQDWSPAQKAALADKAKLVWGEPSTWGDVLLSAGSIVQGLEPIDFLVMNITLRHLEVLGQLDNWAPKQLDTMAIRWMALNGITSGTNILGGQLQQMGAVVCGLGPHFISSVSESAYRQAMAEIGEAGKWCIQEVLEAWAGLALRSLGPVTSWLQADLATVGTVIAGCGGLCLSQLSPSQLSVLDPDTMALIPPEDFAALTVLQLESLSTQQLLAIKPEQLEFLNGSQLDVIIKKLTISGDNDKGAASDMRMAVSLLLTTVAGSLAMLNG
ncbi:putative stereocilin-like protein [Babylonia areolata]|uniref:putative stereocilin-like protein n=1 Tax=Babylonia areolata TaxID=304850 RepID=UPI003FD5C8FB